jgi:MFS family permease
MDEAGESAQDPGQTGPTGVGALLRERNFVAYQSSRVLALLAVSMQSVAVAWQLYKATSDPLALGFVGLSQFLPQICLSLVTGLVADRVPRRKILVVSQSIIALGAVGFLVMTVAGPPQAWLVYLLSALVGVARAFGAPAAQALMPTLVPPRLFGSAVAVGSSTWQGAMIAGPMLGGVLFAAGGPAPVYAATLAFLVVSVCLLFALKPHAPDTLGPKRAVSLSTLFEGVRYVWSNKPVLGAISLDLFAVLLGGAVALLPVFAHDRLHTGPVGLGILRSAPALGAALMALYLAYRPLRRRAGVRMFVAVFVFGLATVVFGLSRNVPLSVAALFVTGAADMISVVVRQTLVQLKTPDEMRGRVSAVNAVFIGASNELGEFESGATAAWLGPVAAVVLGGVGTCIVVIVWALAFRELRQVDNLDASS